MGRGPRCSAEARPASAETRTLSRPPGAPGHARQARPRDLTSRRPQNVVMWILLDACSHAKSPPRHLTFSQIDLMIGRRRCESQKQVLASWPGREKIHVYVEPPRGFLYLDLGTFHNWPTKEVTKTTPELCQLLAGLPARR